MYIDRILFPVETLGPGKRIAVWTTGCTKHCRNCANPELWDTRNKTDKDVSDLARIILNICGENQVDGITFTGGDPLEQPRELISLLRLIKPKLSDILVYTGYRYADLSLLLSSDEMNSLEQLISVLIDGPYIDGLNDNKCALRGSSNQEIIYLDKCCMNKYEAYLSQGRKIQNMMLGNTLISIGIHNRKGN